MENNTNTGAEVTATENVNVNEEVKTYTQEEVDKLLFL